MIQKTKKFLCAALAASLLANVWAPISAAPLTDNKIFTDPVQNTYTGRSQAATMIGNLDFTDIPGEFWAKESIVRSGALDIVKGYGDKYSPNGIVTNQEALAFVLRTIGEEQNSQDAAVRVREEMPENSALLTLWSIGYLNRAMQLGLITRDNYEDALIPDQDQLDPRYSFIRGRAATREQVAHWLVRGLEISNPDAFVTTSKQQSIYPFSDWGQLTAEYVNSMEKALRTGIFKGNANGKLNPKGHLTRAEMAQVLRNMDSIYYGMNGITRKNGTVGGIKDAQETTTGNGSLLRDVYVRTKEGTIDVLRYQLDRNSSPQAGDSDIVCLKDGRVVSMTTLTIGDEIEYLVHDQSSTALYVYVTNLLLEVKTVQGYLQAVNFENSSISITDATGKLYTYTTTDNLIGKQANGADYIIINAARRLAGDIPFGSIVSLSLKNEICDAVTFIGEPVLVDESRGIVTENDADLGILSYIDNSGAIITKSYLSDDMKVKKQQYFQRDDDIGYINEMFPNFKYNPLETSIDQIEPGDIVFMRFDPEDPDVIVNVSASTNYVTKYGKIMEFTDNGDFHSMVIEYESKETSWFDLADGIFISKDGKPITMQDVHIGDWTRLLINEATMEPGVILQSVKEMTIEGDEHFITTVVKGQLTGLNSIQRQLHIKDAETLGANGWGGHQDVQKFSLSGKDIQYFHDGKRISLDYAMQYLKRADGDVYIALENNYSGEKVKKVTFRSERDELLDADSVVSADGSGGFKILSNDGTIETDSGTIVIKRGRLVEGINISNYDFVTVALNGENRAAVVSVTDAPDTSAVTLVRGRILSINEGKSYKVSSMALLSGVEWQYTPVEREFTIDKNTVYVNANGLTTSDSFLGYGENSQLDKVFLVSVTGSHADKIIDAPYAQFAVRGEIYEMTEGAARIKNATVYDNKTGKWNTVSNTNNTLSITLFPNTVVAKNNAVGTQASLKTGDKIKVMVQSLPERVTAGASLGGYIISVE